MALPKVSAEMKTALLIQSFPGANATVARHWPFYKLSGLDLFGVGREGNGCVWPEGVKAVKNIGVDSYINGNNLPSRLVECFRWFYADAIFLEYTHCMVIEYDGIFCVPPPAPPEVAGHLAGYLMPPMKSLKFFHCPWWLSREAAIKFVAKGDELIAAGDYEHGNPDFFFGYVWQVLDIPVLPLVGTYSRNTIDGASSLQECRDLFHTKSMWFFHGVKTEMQLNAITG